MNLRKIALPIALPIAAVLLAIGCSDDADEAGAAPTAEAVSTYSEIVKASYEDSITSAQALDASLETFVGEPTPANLEAAQQAWLDSREPYLQTEVYRFYDGPIDNPDDGPEGLLNAWPLDEAYIDYVEGDDTAGIVNDTDVTIDKASLEGLNEVGGEKNIATGYHAIEFLLWGQDSNPDGAGERPATDYTDASDNHDRRATYLTTVSELMLDHLNQVDAAWAPGAENYRSEFESDSDEALRKILTGMIVLSGFETGGERLQTALDSGDQEDEHSCFSDNTHRDMVQDVRGIQNVYLGRYVRIDGSTVEGVGIRDVIAHEDEALAQQLEEKIAESLSKAEALQPPFDQEIATGNTEGRARVEALIISLREQEDLLEEAFRLFGFDIPQPE